MINGQTKIFGIIGCPVRHSLSPAMHNAAFHKLGMNAAYLPLEVEGKDLKAAIRGIKALGIGGVNITIPHKEEVIKYLDNTGIDVKTVGAANTIVNKNGKLYGYNTDAYGFMKSIRQDLEFNPSRKNIFVVGAGGGAKAVAFSLAMSGAKRIILTDKFDEKALELACEVELKTGCECVALKLNSKGVRDMVLNSQLLVNATPIGMKKGDPCVVNPEFLHKGLCVFDLVYNRRTQLLEAARRRKIKAAGGLNMLLYQGAKTFELWTGKRPPLQVMKKAIMGNS